MRLMQQDWKEKKRKRDTRRGKEGVKGVGWRKNKDLTGIRKKEA